MRSAAVRAALPSFSASPRSFITSASAAASADGVGSQTSPLTRFATSSAGPPLSRQVITPLARGERLGCHEPVVLFERRKADSAAPREVIEQLVFGQRASERHAVRDAELLRETRQPFSFLALPRHDRADAAAFRARERPDQEVGALERRQPGDEEYVVAVPVAPVRTLRRRRIQHGRRQLRPHAEAILDRLRLHEELRHVSRQQIPVGPLKDPPPHAFLYPSARAERRAESIPEIVVLAHRVVEPADVARMPDGVTGVPKADDLVDAVSSAPAHIGEPCRDVGATPDVRSGSAA